LVCLLGYLYFYSNKKMESPVISQEFAQQLFNEGSSMVLLNVPAGTEIGIDMHSWRVGPNFKGIKLIPPGLHFIYYSAVSKEGEMAPRTGFFQMLKPKEIMVRSYNSQNEELVEESEEQSERVRSNIRELDRYLGPYDLSSCKKWFSLTQHLTMDHIQRTQPLSGLVQAVTAMLPAAGSSSTRNSDARKRRRSGHGGGGREDGSIQEDSTINEDGSAAEESSEGTQGASNIEEDGSSCGETSDSAPGLPQLQPQPGGAWRWAELPQRWAEGASPAQLTLAGMDSSGRLLRLMDTMASPEDVLRELQLSFVAFLVGQVWAGWERWGALLRLLCHAERLLLQRPQLYAKLLPTLHFQILEVPEDLFVDIVEQENLVAASLGRLFANIADNSAELPRALVARAVKFRQALSKRFGWLFEEEAEEDAPVVVEL